MRKLTKKEIKIIEKKFSQYKILINDIIKYVELHGSKKNNLEQDIDFAKLVMIKKYQ